jgi:hypothetical protein
VGEPERDGSVDAQRRPIAIVAVLVAVVLCVLVGLPRFAKADHIDPDLIQLTDQPNGWYLDYDDPDVDVAALSFDVYEYHAYVEYFRGDFDRYPIFGPWRWRLVPSLIASWTPIDNPAVAYSVVSLGFLVLGAVALLVAAARHGLAARAQLIVAVLYALSFPLVWYGTSGYVDGSSMALLCVALALIHARRWWWLMVLIPVGMLTKETFLIIIPVAAAFLWVRSERRGDWVRWTVAFGALAVGTFLAARWLLPSPRTLDWYPRIDRLNWNLTRPAALGSFVLTCGVIVPAAAWNAWTMWRDREASPSAALAFRRDLHLVVGVGMGLLVAIHGFLTAYADGRHAWTTYPFAILLAASLIERFLASRSAATTTTVTT